MLRREEIVDYFFLVVFYRILLVVFLMKLRWDGIKIIMFSFWLFIDRYVKIVIIKFIKNSEFIIKFL